MEGWSDSSLSSAPVVNAELSDAKPKEADKQFLAGIAGGMKYGPGYYKVQPLPTESGPQMTQADLDAKEEQQKRQDDSLFNLSSIGDVVVQQHQSLDNVSYARTPTFKPVAQAMGYVYKNVFDMNTPDDQRLAQAAKLSSVLGISSQIMCRRLSGKR